MHEMHDRLVDLFILTAFDMARDQLITPKRLNFARQKEAELHQALLHVANQRQEEIVAIIGDVLRTQKEQIVAVAMLQGRTLISGYEWKSRSQNRVVKISVAKIFRTEVLRPEKWKFKLKKKRNCCIPAWISGGGRRAQVLRKFPFPHPSAMLSL